MEIVGVSHPVPTNIAKRIYNEGKNVFIGKRCLCKVSPGDKFILYESRGARAYTGWADIKSIGKQKTNSIQNKYGNKLMVTKEEFKDYVKGFPEMNVIEFENFHKFNMPVVPIHFVTVGGKYITKKEFRFIDKNRN
ncbi:MAG TPA: DUF365 domain-containing protein [Methanobacterium sp.]|nr:DUF365 domain-containing protein [Methanobacterium sp.]